MYQLLNFELDKIALMAGEPSHKKRRLDDDTLPEVVLVDRTIVVQGDWPIDATGLLESLDQDGSYTTDNIKVTIEDGLIVVKNTRLPSLPPTQMISIGGVSPRVLDEITLVTTPPQRLRKCGLVAPPPSIRLSFSTTVAVELRFSLRCHNEMFRQRPSDIVTRLNSVIMGLRPHDPATALLFYTTIANSTAQLAPVPELDVPELESTLLPFQRKTVAWLLAKEGVELDESNRCIRQEAVPKKDVAGLDDSSICGLLSKFTFGWISTQVLGKTIYYNKYTASVMTEASAHEFLEKYEGPQHLPAQGLLAEEMGLGKTVEMTTLVLLNQRPLEQINERIDVALRQYGERKTIVRAKTTLVVAPDAILKQWVQEIVRLAPSLAVTVYGGVGKYPRMDNNAALIAEYLRRFDVVFTTYLTILRELNFALYSSRNKLTRSRKEGTREEVGKMSEDLEKGKTSEVLARGRSEESESRKSPEEPSRGSSQARSKESSEESSGITVTSVKPRRPNVRTDDRQVETDYEKALQEEMSLALQHVPAMYKGTDYELPLMLTEFWRVVLDEVQMVSSQVSRAFQSAALIPRFHAWGVLGTPIKRGLEDLHSLLTFLKYHPFCGEKLSWEQLTRNSEDFSELFGSLALRHTKAMVENDIRLPPQSRVLLTVPFTPVEQDLYNLYLEECLAAIGLDMDGSPISGDWEPTPAVTMYMSHWLLRLRQVCCNPQIGQLNLGTRKYRKSFAYQGRGIAPIQQLKTLENILSDMLARAHAEIADTERQFVPLFNAVGEFCEYVYDPRAALVFLKLGAAQTERILHRSRLIAEQFDAQDAVDDARTWRQRVRGWLVTLHGFYFLIASAYFQQYDVEYREIARARRLTDPVSLPTAVRALQNVGEDDARKDEIALLVNGVLVEKFGVDVGKLDEVERVDAVNETNEVTQGFELEIRESPQRAELEIAQNSYEEVQHSSESLSDSSSTFQGKETRKPNKDSSDNPSGSTTSASSNQLDASCTSERTNQPVNPLDSLDQHVQLRASSSPNSFSLQALELHYYKLAEETRSRILLASIEAVENAVRLRITSRRPRDTVFVDDGYELLAKTSKTLFTQLPQIDVGVLAGSVGHTRVFAGQVGVVIERLNTQSEAINSWMSELVSFLCKPLLTHDKDPDGAEYEESIADQSRAAALLQVLGVALEDRNEAVVGIDEPRGKTKVKGEKNEATDEELMRKCAKVRPALSRLLEELVLHIKTLEAETQDGREWEAERAYLSALGPRARVVLENQKLALVLMQREVSVHCNAVFNARIEYFKQLQLISDSVKVSEFAVDRERIKREAVALQLARFDEQARALRTRMDKAVGKFRYLKGLVALRGHEGSEEWMCSICRSTITIGSLTQCGHKFCKDCLEQWLQLVPNCPMCKLALAVESVYNFTHYKPDVKARSVVQEASADLHTIYKPLPKEMVEEIALVKLGNMYSTKVDMIVKQVLCLRSKDPDVQIVCFSQWQDMLYILGTAFKAAKVSFLGSYGTHTPARTSSGSKYDAVEVFKDRTQHITCFLLNARAQASGLNLVNATHIFLCEPLINTSLELQAILRIHRIGQMRPTTVWMFAVENTVEESIVVASTRKRLRYMERGGADLSRAESMALMNSEGVEKLMGKATNLGEVVTDDDLWSALFEARAGPKMKRRQE